VLLQTGVHNEPAFPVQVNLYSGAGCAQPVRPWSTVTDPPGADGVVRGLTVTWHQLLGSTDDQCAEVLTSDRTWLAYHATLQVSENPKVDTLSPSKGSAGTVVTLAGSGFGATTQVQYDTNGVDATACPHSQNDASFRIVDDHTLEATVPVACNGRFTVVNAVGSDLSNFFWAPPRVDKVCYSPPDVQCGPSGLLPGEMTYLIGCDLESPLSVTFNGLASGLLAYDNFVEASAQVPTAYHGGPIVIVTPGGSTSFTP
jgi:hypothetical protein